ncbi:hypothetical protein ABEG63_21440 [Chryseobacterium sp. C39-AII1]|uniref:hypothetical protein n=1 Tax=Chryseobacterium sp. C39-AII1 TaxID=3080332 RepID=UPI0032091D8B
MKIEFFLHEKVLFTTSYIKLIHRQEFDQIIIQSSSIKSINLKFGEIVDKDLTIKIHYKSFKSNYIFNVSDIFIKTKEIVLSGLLNDPLGIYNQNYIDNFKLLTEKKDKIQWYELNYKQKYYYLRGCVLLNGVKEDIDNKNSTIIIDLSKVKIDLDVYYEIGKAFFKSYGYFGTEINSFVDCLYSIQESMKNRDKMPVLKIKGDLNFKKYFESNILYNDFYKEFKQSNFEIIKSR